MPVPVPFILESSGDVLGAPFYLMSFVDGELHKDASLPDVRPSMRSSMYMCAVDTLASIHTTNLRSAGLSSFGKQTHYGERLIKTWSQQISRSSKNFTPPTELLQLRDTIVGKVDMLPYRISLIHGDFKMDNMLWGRTRGNVSVRRFVRNMQII